MHAIAILTSDTNPASLGSDLECQLRRSVPGLAEAVAEFGRSVPLPEREKLDPLTRNVVRPLAYLVQKPEVRIVLYGFDRLPELTQEAVREAVAAWPETIRIMITARETPGCPSGHTLDHGMTVRDALGRYLTSRQVPTSWRFSHPRSRRRSVATHASAGRPDRERSGDRPRSLPGTVNETYATLFDQAERTVHLEAGIPLCARVVGARGRRCSASTLSARAGKPDSGRTRGRARSSRSPGPLGRTYRTP